MPMRRQRYYPILSSVAFGLLCFILIAGTSENLTSNIIQQLGLFALAMLTGLIGYFANSQFFVFSSFLLYFISITLSEETIIYTVSSTFFSFFVFVFMRKHIIESDQ